MIDVLEAQKRGPAMQKIPRWLYGSERKVFRMAGTTRLELATSAVTALAVSRKGALSLPTVEPDL